MAHPNVVAEAEVAGGGAGQGSLYLTRAFQGCHLQVAGPVDDRQSVFASRAGGDAAAAGHRHRVLRRAAHDWHHEPLRRSGLELPIVVEQGRADDAGARADLGDRGLRAGGFDGAGAAAVDELQRGQARYPQFFCDGGDDLRAAAGQLADGQRLHRRDRRGSVGGARHLALISHQTDQAEAFALANLPGDLTHLVSRVQGRA